MMRGEQASLVMLNPPIPAITPQQVPIKIAAMPTGIYHIIQPHDTLSSISRRYGISVESLIQANKIKNKHRIQRGMRLLIPGTGPVETTQPVARIPLYDNIGRWQYIIVHHTATTFGNEDAIDRSHRRRGLGEMGYHFLIDNGTMGRSDGEIEIGHRWYTQADGAHTKAFNMNTMGIGIALVGNFSTRQKVTDNQLTALRYLVDILHKHYEIPNTRILRHRDVPGAATECPGKYFPWKRFKDMLD